jgi:hypothetical protein
MKGDETMVERRVRERLERIAQARQALADRYAADPAGVDRFNARMQRLAQARKREQQRIDHLVLGKPRPKPEPGSLTKPAGVSNRDWKVMRKRLLAEGARLEPGIEEALQLREAWSHKQFGTPETWEHAEKTHTDCLVQLERNGSIDKEQLEWAAQIANVYRSLESDVAIKVASLEARVDQSRRATAAVEGVRRVRLHLAYGYWRDQLPDPKQMILDMIVGDPIGYTVAAKRYGVHNRKAKRLLIAAIDSWPECVDRAHRLYSADEIKTAQAGLEK